MYRLRIRNIVRNSRHYAASISVLPQHIVGCLTPNSPKHYYTEQACHILGYGMNSLSLDSSISFLYDGFPTRIRIVFDDLMPETVSRLFRLGSGNNLIRQLEVTKSKVPLSFIFQVAQYIEDTEVDKLELGEFSPSDKRIYGYILNCLGVVTRAPKGPYTGYTITSQDIDLNACISVLDYLYTSHVHCERIQQLRKDLIL